MNIDISNINLDILNFRHEEVSDQYEALRTMLLNEREHKVAELAQDIIEMGGLDPSSQLIVTADPLATGHYIALEGNRRITALKTLVNPELAKDLPTYSIFKSLSPKFLNLKIKQVDCVELDRNTAFQWIKRKHYNGMGGRGVLAWGAIATARSDASEGKIARWMAAINFLKSNGALTETIVANIANKTTTVDRVLSSSHISKVLGLSFEKNGTIIPENGDNTAATNLITALMEKMAEKDFKETKVTNSELQERFINQFQHLSVKKNPAPHTPAAAHQANTTTSTSSNAPRGSTGGQQNAPNTALTTSNPVVRSKPVVQRKYLAKPGLRISNNGLNKLYSELKKLNIEANPHTGSGIQRVFLEKATMVFIDSMNIACRNPKGWHDHTIKLREKVEAVLQVLDSGKTEKDLNYAWDIANSVKDKIHTLDFLNEAIHSHKSIPSPLDIITVWDRLHEYYNKLFLHLEANGK